MALKMDYEFKGMLIPNGYCRIDRIVGNKEQLICFVGFYLDQTATQRLTNGNENFYYLREVYNAPAGEPIPENMLLIKSYAYTPDVTPGAENNFKQGYEYLKTLAEFMNAVDC